MKDAKVYSAAVLGFCAPGLNLFMESIEPILKALVLFGQIGVAVVTICYIFTKWKQLKNPVKRGRKPRK